MADLLDRVLELDEKIEKLRKEPSKSFIARGLWSPAIYYMPGDLVAYDGKSYLCVTRTKALPSDETDYVLFADRGIQGEQGIEGEKGLKGDDADPAEVADEIKKDIEFIAKIKGAKGDTGPQGPKGDKGDPGKDGAKGPKGEKGDKGDDGPSAYDVWKNKGNKGSEQDFLNSLKGETYIAGAGSRVPNGGTTGQVLKKASNADQDLVWGSGGSGGGQVDTVVAGNNIDVDNTDPSNPIVSVENLTLADITDVTASATELNYVDGVTSAIQTQLDGKQASLGYTAENTSNKDTDGTLTANSDTKYASQKATKTYADTKLAKSSNLSDVTNAATAFGNIKQAASDTATGVVELATIAETDTGTDATRAVTPDGLSGSVYGTKITAIQVIDGATTLSTGDGKAYFRIPSALNGMNLVSCGANVLTKSTSGTPTIQIARGRQANATSAFTFADMLSTRITIDANEYDSKDAATAAVIDTANDDVATGDMIRIDVDVAGTGTTGLNVTLSFRTP